MKQEYYKKALALMVIPFLIASCELLGLDYQDSYDYDYNAGMPSNKIDMSAFEFIKSRTDIFSLLEEAILYAGVENEFKQSGMTYLLPTNTAFNYLKANGNRISGQISTTTKDYIINYQDMQGIGMTGNLALPTLIAISSAALNKPLVSSMVVLGEISIGGTLIKVEELASTLQVCLDSGAKKVLLPMTSAADLGTVPSDLVGAFSLIFYSSPEEAVYKALGVE